MTVSWRQVACLICLLPVATASAQPAVRLGVDRFLDAVPSWAQGRTVALLTNNGAVDGAGRPVADRLAEAKQVRLAAYFAPEHGLTVDRQGDITDGRRNGRPVYSLYGSRMAPDPQVLKGMDLLLCDLPDVGARFYTYISTMSLAMKAAKQAGRPFVVLDRPNPINGETLEGPVLQLPFVSFTGPHPIPVRHGMTMGELAGLFNRAYGIGCDLKVVPMSGWTRGMWHDQTGLAWRNPSPMMKSLATATLYPGMCFFEATNVNTRLEDRPFQAITAPWLNAPAVAAEVAKLHLPGVSLAATRLDQGPAVTVTITDRQKLRPVRLAFELLAAVHKYHPTELKLEPKGFDRLAGTDQVRMRLLAGDPASTWDPDPNAIGDFDRLRRDYLLYP